MGEVLNIIRWRKPAHRYSSFFFEKARAFFIIATIALSALAGWQAPAASADGSLVALIALPLVAAACWLSLNLCARRLNELTITTDFETAVLFESSRVTATLTLEDLARNAQVDGAFILVPSIGVRVVPTHIAAARLRVEILKRQGRFGPTEAREQQRTNWTIAAVFGLVFAGLLVGSTIVEWRDVSHAWSYVQIAFAVIALAVAGTAAVRASEKVPPNSG